jgi:hypothetical protein
MERLTTAADCGYAAYEAYIQKCAEGYTGEAIEKLAKFENMLERLLKEQGDTAARLEKLRKEGREKSVTFKQLLAKKLTYSGMLALFESHGIVTSF